MATKLIKACKELKIGMSAAIEFAEASGFHIDKDPNVRVNDELYLLLAQKFRTQNDLLENEVGWP
jgi:translation initiation factor IF-2